MITVKYIKYIIFLSMLCIVSSCASSGYIPSPYGDNAELILNGNKVLNAELLSVTDTMIFVVNSNNIIGIRNKNLKSVYFKKYKDDSWIIGVGLMEVLPAIAISLVASAMDADFGSVFAITIIPAAISTSLFLVSTPKTTYDDFKDVKDVFSLKKFSRYPGGITEKQMKDLLTFYNQESCIYMK